MDKINTQIHINKDFIKKLDIFKLLIDEYSDNIYNDIIDECLDKNYLKKKSVKIPNNNNGSNRN